MYPGRGCNGKDISKGNAELVLMSVFVSPAFRDMHDERNELVKFFPPLHKLCEKRSGIWGITNYNG